MLPVQRLKTKNGCIVTTWNGVRNRPSLGVRVRVGVGVGEQGIIWVRWDFAASPTHFQNVQFGARVSQAIRTLQNLTPHKIRGVRLRKICGSKGGSAPPAHRRKASDTKATQPAISAVRGRASRLPKKKNRVGVATSQHWVSTGGDLNVLGSYISPANPSLAFSTPRGRENQDVGVCGGMPQEAVLGTSMRCNGQWMAVDSSATVDLFSSNHSERPNRITGHGWGCA